MSKTYDIDRTVEDELRLIEKDIEVARLTFERIYCSFHPEAGYRTTSFGDRTIYGSLNRAIKTLERIKEYKL
jgi:hypothetical protein